MGACDKSNAPHEKFDNSLIGKLIFKIIFLLTINNLSH